MIAVLHGIAYLVPGAVWLWLAFALRRVTSNWLTSNPGDRRAPAWIRRWIAVSTILLAATGLALAGIGAFLSIVIQL